MRGSRRLARLSRIVRGDIRHVDYGSVDAIVIGDVLHYRDYASLEAELERARAALAPRGVLLARVAHAAVGLLLSTLP